MNCHQKASEMKEVLKTERANCQLVPEDGILECEETGTCKLQSLNIMEHASAIYCDFYACINDIFKMKNCDIF